MPGDAHDSTAPGSEPRGAARDDRGNPVELRLFARDSDAYRRLTPEQRRTLREEGFKAATRDGPKNPWLGTAMPVAIGIVFGILIILFPNLLQRYWWTLLALVIAGGLLLPWWVIRREIRRHDPVWMRAWCDLRICPACGYDLTGQPVAGDGCTVCPECAAAWRVPTSG
ncbi:MAG: hypothetical protein JNK35_03060 [Phycisphaerae bacterium]|nr:hypothetical protein [Phycisphaerae bacterium]